MFEYMLVLLSAVLFVKIAHSAPADLGITPPQLQSVELKDLAQRILDDTGSIRNQALVLANAADDEIRRLNALVPSYSSLLTALKDSNPSCSADVANVTSSTFQGCVSSKDTIDSIISKAKETAQDLLGQLQTADSDLAKITDVTQKKLKIAETNWLICSDFYHFVTITNNGLADERYNIQSCIDETSAQIRGQVQVNLRMVKGCLTQKS